ncbi:MAG: AmmeMemoRadiSam system protein B [Planctomycetota bacterium]|jgi:AmmeMemoRadiSam system protein B/AmmeMemoRadiSam system protein A
MRLSKPGGIRLPSRVRIAWILFSIPVLFLGCGSSSQTTAGARSQAFAQEPPAPPEPIRSPVYAGSWYPGEAESLRTMVTRFLDGAKAIRETKRVVALVSPHAGYVFSGPVAAEAYATIRGASFDTVLLLGSSHRFGLDGVSVVPKGSYKTPLGTVPIDDEVASALLKNPTGRIRHVDEAHAKELGLELQLPFLQTALDGPFRIVPILIHARDVDDYAILADALDWLVDDSPRKILLVASTDLSHFPSHEDAVKVDREIFEAAASLDPVRLLTTNRDIMKRSIPNLKCAACGLDALVAVVLAAKAFGGRKAKILDLRNSSQVTGKPKAEVVGYGAMAILGGQESGLSLKTKRLLISVAREAAEAALAGREPELPNPGEVPGEARTPCGAFVTLKRKGEVLRGCLGSYNLDSTIPLYLVVARMAVSATRDSRFRDDPVTLDEMKNRIRVEISVLSPFRRVRDPKQITLGVHGVSLVWDGRRRSVYLPQVATETGWDLDTFLSRLCRKGGLAMNAWKDRKRMEFDIFTAEVFHE